MIGKFDAYYKVNSDVYIEDEYVAFPDYLQSLDYKKIYSESAAINCAYVTGILARFMDDTSLLPTVSGRMGSSKFDFSITGKGGTYKIAVNNSQCEIDGGYEGEQELLLIEAKNFSVDDFLIRQIYYPFRLWSSKITKRVIPVFMTYSNDGFTLRQFQFQDISDYNSIILIKQKRYIIAEEDDSIIKDKDLQLTLSNTQVVDEQEIPFPQADSFSRVIDLLSFLSVSDKKDEEITEYFGFDPRQTGYYTNAGKYLELIEGDFRKGYRLTNQGKRIVSLPYKKKTVSLVSCILKHKVFNETLKYYFKNSQRPVDDEVVKYMKMFGIYNVHEDTTYYRRSKTVLKWIDWIVSLAVADE